jgi:hypothetical protein
MSTVRLSTALVSLLLACAGRGTPARLSSFQSSPVTGTVLGSDLRPLAGQVVAAGGARTTSDAAGRFTLPSVAGPYDLVVASPDGAAATLYRGLSRRDPVVMNHPAPRASRPHQATIAGTVTGASEIVQIHFSSDTGDGLTSWRPGGGPTFDGLTVEWAGAESITGTVAALSMTGSGDQLGAIFARKQVTLRAGETAKVDLALAPVALARRPPLALVVPKSHPGPRPNVDEHYRRVGSGWVFQGANLSASHAYPVPDLDGYGIHLCTYAHRGDPYLRAKTLQCGVDVRQRTPTVLHAPPAFSAPAWGTPARPGLPFTWSAAANAVYVLRLHRVRAAATARHPSVVIVTAATREAWPDLQSAGVAFPSAPVGYAAVIGACGPFASIDDYVGPSGMAHTTPRERWQTDSSDFSVPVLPPLGKEQAACPDRSGVVCGPDEVYQLTAMNRKLRSFPDFASAAGIRCVRDCESARAFTKAYAQYSRVHPGFDADQIVEPDPPEPLPPPGFFDE